MRLLYCSEQNIQDKPNLGLVCKGAAIAPTETVSGKTLKQIKPSPTTRTHVHVHALISL